MRSIYLIISLCILLISCEQQAEKAPPQKLLPLRQMASIVADLQLADAAIGLSNISQQRGITRFNRYEADIFKKNNIDSATYYRNYEYYFEQQSLRDQVLKAVDDTLLLRKHRSRQAQLIRDSLARLKQDSIKAKNLLNSFKGDKKSK